MMIKNFILRQASFGILTNLNDEDIALIIEQLDEIGLETENSYYCIKDTETIMFWLKTWIPYKIIKKLIKKIKWEESDELLMEIKKIDINSEIINLSQVKEIDIKNI